MDSFVVLKWCPGIKLNEEDVLQRGIRINVECKHFYPLCGVDWSIKVQIRSCQLKSVGNIFHFWVKLLHVYVNASISLDCTGLKKKRKGKKIFKCGFSSLIFARYLQTSLKCSEKIYLQLLLDFSSLQKNSQPLNLHFAVAEIFTLKSITLCVWHILEHRKSIYLGVMRNSGVNLAKELLQSPPLLILSALYTCAKQALDPRHIQKRKPPKNPAIIWWKKFHWFCMWFNLTWYDPALDNLRRKSEIKAFLRGRYTLLAQVDT